MSAHCFFGFFVCLSLFLPSHFLTFGKPKCFHASDLKLTGASTKLCQLVSPSLLAASHSFAQLLRARGKVRESKNAWCLEKPQNRLEAKTSSQIKWATCAGRYVYIYISSYILYGTPMCRIQQNGKFVWEHLSNTSVSKILKTLTQTVVNEFTLSRKCSHSSSSVPTLLLLHYTCLYLQLQYDYFMKQWNTLYQAFMTINAALDQNSPFSGWLNIYRLRLPVSEHGRSSPLLAHNWRCFPQQPSAWASVDSHLISLALWDLISVGVYHALSHKNKKMWKNFHLIYRG